MVVYIIFVKTGSAYGEDRVDSVFSNKELAEEYVSELNRNIRDNYEGAHIKEFLIDEVVSSDWIYKIEHGVRNDWLCSLLDKRSSKSVENDTHNYCLNKVHRDICWDNNGKRFKYRLYLKDNDGERAFRTGKEMITNEVNKDAVTKAYENW
jgi:hypothetical protein